MTAAAPAVDPTETCRAWARHYFAEADEAVQQYACQSLLAALEEGESLLDQGEALRDFLPGAGASDRCLELGLAELEAALSQPGQQHGAYAWLHPRAAAAGSGAPPAAPGDAVPRAQDASQQQQLEQQPAAAMPGAGTRRAGMLSVAAAEFTPGGPAGAVGLAADVAALRLSGNNGAADGWAEDHAGAEGAAGWGGGGWPADGPGGKPRWQGAADGRRGAQPGPASPTAAAEAAAADGALAAGGPAAEAAFLAVLADQFPLFSADALRGLFEQQGGSLAATITTLCALEAELEGQAAAGAVAAAGAPASPAFTPDDFPSLGGPVPAPGGAAARPAPAPAPIWEQREGVQRFATGAALAEEYAALRADARDLARLRNACFTQATQAYLAGNRRLARELGAQGRQYGERMHAAHAEAAQQLFAARNPGGGGGGGGGARTLDLHGLHVAEALAALEARLAERRHGGGRLRVVVGRGQHGRVPARLPAAVRRWLADQGVPFTEPYAGLLELQL